jgi:hypothetical protein
MKLNVFLSVLIAVLSGCVHLDMSSAADCDENSKTNFCDVVSAYGWDWGKSAQNLLDDTLQRSDGTVDERAVQRIVISQEWWEVMRHGARSGSPSRSNSPCGWRRANEARRLH